MMAGMTRTVAAQTALMQGASASLDALERRPTGVGLGAALLEAHDLSCGYAKGRPVISGLDFVVRPGEIVCLLGPNGIGKTTVFRSVLGQIPLLSGEVLIEGREMGTLSRREMAKSVGYVPQAHVPPFPFTVREVVLMGRTAHLSLFSAPSQADTGIAMDVLAEMGIEGLADKPYTEISGGERQLVLIARALAQETRMLVMDEPAANLDFGNQIHLLEQLRRLAERGLGILMTTHFPDHALLCSTSVVIVSGPGDFITGRADEVMTAQLLHDLYHVEVEICDVETSAGFTKVCVPLMARWDGGSVTRATDAGLGNGACSAPRACSCDERTEGSRRWDGGGVG